MKFLKEKEMIKAVIEDVEMYNLINNYGFQNDKLDIRHILNVYGAETDFWEVKDKAKDGTSGCVVQFNTFEKMLEYLKEMK